MKEKVVVGLSGGVDSSVAAYLLKEQGYEVIGVTMHTWGEEISSGVADARRVAEVLDIPHHVVDFRRDFKREVIDYFICEYKNACTPNPCNVCNRRVKWGGLLAYAKELGASYIATGHYARVKELENGRFTIQNSITAEKDQTYALYNLTQDQLAHTLMPVGVYTKAEIRAIAEGAGLPVAHKQDSQDICFIPDGDYAGFIKGETGESFPEGDFVDPEGNVLGTHRGIIHYTIGQRKGLGLTAPTPLFVKELRSETNEVVVCKAEELFDRVCFVKDMNFMGLPELSPGDEVGLIGKVRYSHKGAACTLRMESDGRAVCSFDEPQRAMTPGQAAVFYLDDYVACGGIITRA